MSPPATSSTSPAPSSSGVCDPVKDRVSSGLQGATKRVWAATTSTSPFFFHTVDSSDGCSPRSMGTFLMKAPFASVST